MMSKDTTDKEILDKYINLEVLPEQRRKEGSYGHVLQIKEAFTLRPHRYMS